MILSPANHPALSPQLPPASESAAASGAPRRASERPAAPGPLQPRADGSDAGAALAPRQALQVLRPAGQAVAGAAAGAVPTGQHVIDIDWPGLPPAGAGGGQAASAAHSPDRCSPLLFVIGGLAGIASLVSIRNSVRAPSPGERLVSAATAALGGMISTAAYGILIATSRRGRHPAIPAVPVAPVIRGDRREVPQWLGYRERDLHGLPLGEEVARFGEKPGQLGPAAKQFNWDAPNLFVDRAAVDQTQEVSHLLTRALRECPRPENPIGANPIGAIVGTLLDKLATHPELRTDLADRAADANGHCKDRIGIRLGELLLTQALGEIRDAAAAPGDVVLTLVLHAATQAMKRQIATQAMKKQIAGQPGRPDLPSADLLLAGFHTMQSTLQQQGIAVPTLFPADDRRDEEDLHAQRGTLQQDARAIVARYGLQSAEAASSSQAGAASAEGRGAGLALLLRDHGGKAYEDILVARLDHLRAAVLAEWQDRDSAGKGSDGYLLALDQAFGRAIAGALGGDLSDWTPPAASPGRAGG
jgi:hypothetical protein